MSMIIKKKQESLLKNYIRKLVRIFLKPRYFDAICIDKYLNIFKDSEYYERLIAMNQVENVDINIEVEEDSLEYKQGMRLITFKFFDLSKEQCAVQLLVDSKFLFVFPLYNMDCKPLSVSFKVVSNDYKHSIFDKIFLFIIKKYSDYHKYNYCLSEGLDLYNKSFCFKEDLYTSTSLVQYAKANIKPLDVKKVALFKVSDIKYLIEHYSDKDILIVINKYPFLTRNKTEDIISYMENNKYYNTNLSLKTYYYANMESKLESEKLELKKYFKEVYFEVLKIE